MPLRIWLRQKISLTTKKNIVNMTKYKEHYDVKLGKRLKPIFNGYGSFVGWLEVSK